MMSLAYLDMQRQPVKPTRVLAAIEDYYPDNANVHRGAYASRAGDLGSFAKAREEFVLYHL